MIVISKEKFVGYINFIKELREKERKFNEGLSECFGEQNVANIFVYNDVENKIIEMLCDLVGIEYNKEDKHVGDDIQYFIYELDFGEVGYAQHAVEIDGKTYDLSSAEKLYDYLVEMDSKIISEEYQNQKKHDIGI